ncbi:interactor protein for cytohesin exchange factors 1-like [Astyanax mexicanus]|uniref:Interactor protein for cytohesin exchange factors 1-like n=1 Tax=Astyanax mexicanus TaxID=7994 RepID=A0A8T2M9S4_ASTMX|nr:interactor protein for cytohesin exchange factors 1-like [Astyanax mexicanus]
MSTGEGGVVLTPLCQGFLKKRKDKMRLRWVTYWFKLHNTTLFFYTKKNGSTLDLRGKYYLFEVESVQEVMRTENKRYLFELTMKNGKRKVLAADTADLRQEWICQLLKAMNHSSLHTTQLTSDRFRESFSDHEQRADSNPCSSRSSFSSTSESSSFRRPNSNMSDYLWSSSTSSQTASHHTPQRFSTSQDMTSLGISQHPEDEVEHKMEEIKLESDYDVLPAPKSLNYEEAIYDTPPSNRRASGRNHEMTESIYDVPKSIFMRADGDERPASGGLLIDMMACLGERLSDLGQSS